MRYLMINQGISPWKQQPRLVDRRQFIQKPVRQRTDQLFGNSHNGTQCLLKQAQHDGQRFQKAGLLQFFTSGVKQRSERPGIFVHSSGQLQHDIAAAYHGGMSGQGIIGTALTLFGQIEKRLGHFEEHLDVPSALIELDDFLIAQSQIGTEQSQPPFAAPVPDEDDLCRNRDALVVFADSNHNRGENLCTAATLSYLPVDGRQMEILSLVAAVKVRAQRNQAVFLLIGGQQSTANRQKTDAVRPPAILQSKK